MICLMYLLICSMGPDGGMAVAGRVPRIVHTVHGTVLAVDRLTRSLTVQARRMETWMGRCCNHLPRG